MRQSIGAQHELFLATALVAAHSMNSQLGFRLRDAKFLSDLCQDWCEALFRAEPVRLHSTQLLRYLRTLDREGLARVRGKERPVRYLLTRSGLIELLKRCREQSFTHQPHRFFFLVYFLRSYRRRILELIVIQGREFPPALRIEVEQLLDVEELLRRERRTVASQIAQSEARIASALRTEALMSALLSRGVLFEEATREIEKRFPYNLNSMKPLSSLMSELPLPQQRWELTAGQLRRVDHLWSPSLALLRGYAQELERLHECLCSGPDTPL